MVETETNIDKAVAAFRALLEQAVTARGVEVNVPYREITSIISMATGRPTAITVTETLWPGSEDFRAIWKNDAPQA